MFALTSLGSTCLISFPGLNGFIFFVPRNFLNLIVEPFKNIRFWHPRSWDINWVFVTLSSIGLYTLSKNAIKRS